MTAVAGKTMEASEAAPRALECDFPILEVSQLAEHESWRKEINRPLSHIHKWWATRLGSVFRAITIAALVPQRRQVWNEFYTRHQMAGKIVLDPFMGSGTTLCEALKLGAKAIGCDINPVSTFIVQQALTRVSETSLRTAFDKLETSVGQEIRRYYLTRDRKTGESIPVLYFFWVKMVKTPEGEAIPLFDRYVFAQDAYPKKKPRAQIICPSCWDIFEGLYNDTAVKCPHCSHLFNAQEGPASGQYVQAASSRYRIKDLLPAGPPVHRLYAMLAINPDGEKVYLAARPEDHALYEEAQKRLSNESLPLPTLPVRSGHNTDQARGYNYLHWRDFFNDRQLLCLGLLLRDILRIEELVVQEQLVCLFSSTLEFNNLFCSYKGEGTGAVRHMFSNHILKPERTPLENSVWGLEKSSGTFSTLFESRLLRAKQYLDRPFEIMLDADLFKNARDSRRVVVSDPITVECVSSWNELETKERSALILNGDSSHLPIPDLSVDAVITDPPYFDFVHYSELSDFFFAWLSPALKGRYSWFNRSDSSHSGEVQHKDREAFARQLSCVLAESHRVLKDNGILSFSFHHSREEGWAAIHDAIARAGFEVVAAYPVHAELRAASPKSAAKEPISLDAILVCRKHVSVQDERYEIETVVSKTEAYVRLLLSAGMSLSPADLFVIAASQVLISSSAEELPLEQILVRLREARQRVAAYAGILTSR